MVNRVRIGWSDSNVFDSVNFGDEVNPRNFTYMDLPVEIVGNPHQGLWCPDSLQPFLMMSQGTLGSALDFTVAGSLLILDEIEGQYWSSGPLFRAYVDTGPFRLSFLDDSEGPLFQVKTDASLGGVGTEEDPLRAIPARTAAEVGDAAFTHPPADLTPEERAAVRQAIGIGRDGSVDIANVVESILSEITTRDVQPPDMLEMDDISLQILSTDNVRLTDDSASGDSIGSLEGLKRQAIVEHADDDVLLTELFLNAAQLVGNITQWPMRTGDHQVTATWFRPTPGMRLRLPGPVKADTVQLNGISRTPDYDVRLPHDAYLTMAEGPSGTQQVTYTRSWASWYPLPGWPEAVATAIYRVAATLYQYREATPLGEGPIRKILSSTLGPNAGSGKGRPNEEVEI